MKMESARRSGLSNFPVTSVPMFLIKIEDMGALYQSVQR
jgi:hypothetical protein